MCTMLWVYCRGFMRHETKETNQNEYWGVEIERVQTDIGFEMMANDYDESFIVVVLCCVQKSNVKHQKKLMSIYYGISVYMFDMKCPLYRRTTSGISYIYLCVTVERHWNRPSSSFSMLMQMLNAIYESKLKHLTVYEMWYSRWCCMVFCLFRSPCLWKSEWKSR